MRLLTSSPTLRPARAPAGLGLRGQSAAATPLSPARAASVARRLLVRPKTHLTRHVPQIGRRLAWVSVLFHDLGGGRNVFIRDNLQFGWRFLKVTDDVPKVTDDVLKVTDGVPKVERDVFKVGNGVLNFKNDVLKVERGVLKVGRGRLRLGMAFPTLGMTFLKLGTPRSRLGTAVLTLGTAFPRLGMWRVTLCAPFSTLGKWLPNPVSGRANGRVRGQNWLARPMLIIFCPLTFQTLALSFKKKELI